MPKTFRSNLALVAILLVALVWRAWLIDEQRVAFTSDEAIVGLMARHINQGEPIPTFYYGQAYMGSADAILIAGGFALLGDSVETIRWVQTLLYLLTLISTYVLTMVITQNQRLALMAVLLLAIPTVLGATYTTLTLGGYNEIILLGNLIFALGWWVTIRKSRHAWAWAALGFCMGLGWWINGAIVTPIAVVGLMGLRDFSFNKWHLYGLAATAFMIGSAPWWLYNLQNDWAALTFLLDNELPPGVESLTFFEKVIALGVIGFSALYGFRAPWETVFLGGLATVLAGGVYILLISDMLLHWRRSGALWRWVLACIAVLSAVFLLSSFQDATGRYLLPIWVPISIGVAAGISYLRPRSIGVVALAVLLTFQAITVLQTAQDSGLEAQLDADLRLSAQHDAALLAFLHEAGYTHGYSSYWVSYRMMFIAEEAVIFDTSLPYDENGYRPQNNRYEPYVEAVAGVERVVWITQNFPALDAVIADKLADASVTYATTDIGPYRIYFDFSERVAPAEFGFDQTIPLEDL